MAKVLTTLRTHWKKSIFFTLAGGYGLRWGHRKYEEDRLMTHFCLEASQYGQMAQPLDTPLYNVTVILNPAANGGQARKNYEAYCAPILNCAGLRVSVVRTEGIGEAKTLMEIMKEANAVLVAGGDGTLMETVSGLCKRPDADVYGKSVPIGVLPVGKTNTMAQNLFPRAAREGISEVELMANAAMAVVKQVYRPMDVLQLENISDSDLRGRCVHGLSMFHMGAFKDAHKRMSKYWYMPKLKQIMGYVFAYSTAQKDILWSCNSDLAIGTVEEMELKVPEVDPSSNSWWSYLTWPFQPRSKPVARIFETKWDLLPDFNGFEIRIATPNNEPFENKPTQKALDITLGPEEMGFSDYVKEGFAREKGEAPGLDNPHFQRVSADKLRFFPKMEFFQDKDHMFSVDGEDIEVSAGALELSLLPDKFVMFCGEEARLEVKSSQEVSTAKWWQRSAGTARPIVSMSKQRL